MSSKRFVTGAVLVGVPRSYARCSPRTPAPAAASRVAIGAIAVTGTR